MGYVDKNLLSDEQVVYNAKIHWYIFVPGVFLFIVGVVVLPINAEEGFGPVLGGMAIMLSLVLLVRAFIQKITTELAVTSKRVIAKMGLIRRSTIELNHSKVESFNVEQSIAGRIFGFGTLVVNGTGGGKTPIPNIDSPLEFRREAMQAIDSAK